MTKNLKTKLVVLFASLMLLCVAVLGLNQTLVKANSTYAGLTGTASEVTAEVAIEDGEFVISDYAEIKTVSPNGIRFDTTVKASLLEKLPTDAQFGTLIVPTKILGQTELNLANASAVKANVVYANQYLFDTTEGNEGNGLYKATLLGTQNGESFDDFLREYYDVEISARSFVKYTVGGQEKTAYTNTISWSMAQVAGRNIALADTLGLDPEEVEFLWPILGAGVQDNDAGVVLAANTTEGYEIDLTEKVSGDILKVYDMEMNDVTNLATGKTVNVTVGANRGEMGYLAITEREAVATMFTVADGLIDSKEDFIAMMGTPGSGVTSTVTGYYVQTADIDLTGHTYKSYGSNYADFKAVYDGQGYSIIGGTTNGWFSNVSGTVKNVVLVGTTATRDSGTGGAVSRQVNSTAVLDNIYLFGIKKSVETDTNYQQQHAKFVGEVRVNATIRNCLLVDTNETAGAGSKFMAVSNGGANVTNTFGITSNYSDVEEDGKTTVSTSLGEIVADYDTFEESADMNGYLYIKTDDLGRVYVGEGTTKSILKDIQNVALANSTAVVDAVDGGTFAFDQLDGKAVEMVIINNKQVAFTQSGKSITVAGSEVSSLEKKESEMLIKVGSVIYSTTVKVCDRIIDSAEDFTKYVAPFHSTNKGKITGYFVQTKDLNMEGVANICSVSDDVFAGVYDGQGYSIIGGTTNGWFGDLTGTVKNVVIVGTTLDINTYSGALAVRITHGGSAETESHVDNVYVINVNTAEGVSDASNNTGLLAGKWYSYAGGASITNVLVVDNGVANYQYAVLGQWASSAGSATLTNVHAITSKTVFAHTKVPTYTHLHADYSAFASAATLSGFKYLDTDASGNVTVGRGTTKTTIYTAPVGE
ncbi:MAG: hypothetical protein IKA11_00900 [Clostridia bacterium]|nr:hypothetical protein [Clostridia bacterium]